MRSGCRGEGGHQDAGLCAGSLSCMRRPSFLELTIATAPKTGGGRTERMLGSFLNSHAFLVGVRHACGQGWSIVRAGLSSEVLGRSSSRWPRGTSRDTNLPFHKLPGGSCCILV